MELGKHVVDKELLDRDGRRAGKVDDLLLSLSEPGADGALPEPEVTAIVSGPLALSRDLPRWVFRLARFVYRVLGLADPSPSVIPWDRVAAIDVVVHLDIDREGAGMTALAEAVRRRYISKIPGA